ncbi:ribonuclease H-like protein [Hypoxylon trugodes]|uniref:ribonuclease H-like protein n=1 Tax=Hypoxylon trugodes TaxID=326681 RepID=UPI00219D9719|nr:ribonuclease H-like protein [Hypoxylon trugodes]KAI1385965.1 ribonuclease H-like protein [Hypoxylon trugodes]
MQGEGLRNYRCDCSAILKDAHSINKHVRKTGHMKERWCIPCHRLFVSSAALHQHRRDSPLHGGRPPPLRFTAAFPQAYTYIPPSSVPRATMSSFTLPDRAENVEDLATRARDTLVISENPPPQATLYGSDAVPNLFTPALAQPVDIAQPKPLPPTIKQKYPWATDLADNNLPQTLNAISLHQTLESHCHSEDLLMLQSYYTGDATHAKRLKYEVKTFLPTPARVPGVLKRKAIAIDCEMVGLSKGRDELAQICAIDVITGEVLMDTLVFPTETVQDWRTKYSGVTRVKMTEAQVSGKILYGWPKAREELFRHADENTILLGHALNNDLKVLHIIHKRVVDSGIVAAEAVFGKEKVLRRWRLKKLCQEFLGANIQASKKGHDCVEDTFAAREVVLWCFKEPEKLKAWASKTLTQYEADKKKREDKQKEKAKKKEEDRKKAEEKHMEEWGREFAGRYTVIERCSNDDRDRIMAAWQQYLVDHNRLFGHD